ncbi:chain length determinant protein [Catenovulum agarivorans DS-2]|uniref:Chain length determinant protein n=1 Tax=Catenovulum agarivorans DS-2 TaxID=1328313 RepID=W7Q908_9ALTE|nr:Wzz/FepE/Etk N-terminal domain-containing protein [Catenovulum agarivorans]EWH08501.1 chain length determinant protein [Catenovulum agarivorans DS-2]
MDKELEYRLARIEEKLTGSVNERDSDFVKQQADDEIDLRELWNVIWAGRIKIVAITAVFAVASVIYALSLPNMYKSEMILAPAQTDGKSGMGALAAQYGGLAAMAGINLEGGGSSQIDQAVELIKSWPFLEKFVDKYNLKPQIMAVERWDQKTGKIIYDNDVFNAETAEWVGDVHIDSGDTPEPSSFETFRALKAMLSVSSDKERGMVLMSVEHYSPQIAYEWVELLKQEINTYYQQQDMAEARKNIDYLQAKIGQTNVTDMHSVFYNMIENQTKTLMLAEVSEQYLLKTVVPAKIAEEKSKPRRSVICILVSFIGVVMGLSFVFVEHFIKNKEI